MRPQPIVATLAMGRDVRHQQLSLPGAIDVVMSSVKSPNARRKNKTIQQVGSALLSMTCTGHARITMTGTGAHFLPLVENQRRTDVIDGANDRNFDPLGASGPELPQKSRGGRFFCVNGHKHLGRADPW